jgi:hypothetical protein
MDETIFTLNGSVDRYSYSVSNYFGAHGSASSNRSDIDATGIDLASSLSHTPTNVSCVEDCIMNSSLQLQTDDTLQSLYEVPTGVTALLSLFYGSISVIAVVGNSLVMWIVATSRRMQNVTNCFIANLALADIVIGLFAIPFQVSRFAP